MHSAKVGQFLWEMSFFLTKVGELCEKEWVLKVLSKSLSIVVKIFFFKIVISRVWGREGTDTRPNTHALIWRVREGRRKEKTIEVIANELHPGR